MFDRKRYEKEYRKKTHFYRKRDWKATNEDIKKFEDDCVLQCSRCSICGETKPLIYDHNHRTGTYRGAICRDCNKLLGFAKDNISVLKGAIDYLSK